MRGIINFCVSRKDKVIKGPYGQHRNRREPSAPARQQKRWASLQGEEHMVLDYRAFQMTYKEVIFMPAAAAEWTSGHWSSHCQLQALYHPAFSYTDM